MNKNFIEKITSAFGPSGFEEDVLKVIIDEVKDFDWHVDSMNNLYVKSKNFTGKKPVIMLDAHTDEVGFMVQSIKSNGTLSIVPLGGWVGSNIPAHTVHIKNGSGKLIRGITVSKPPHFMTNEEKSKDKIEVSNITIDIGATSYDDVIKNFNINVGDPVAPIVDGDVNEKTGLIFGKAFDNRLGCVAIVETLKRLEGENLPFEVIGAFASQEEVGMRGATVTSQVVKPDVAIIFEGSPSDDLYFDDLTSQCALGQGTQIRHMDASYVSNRRFINFAKEIADNNNIKYQSAVRRAGSTNAGKIHTTLKSVPCLVLGIPSRFVHSHYNHAKIEDLESTVNLAVETIKSLKADTLESPLNQ